MAIRSTSVFTVDRVSDLPLLKPVQGQQAQTLGYYNPTDGGGNLYQYEAASTANCDGGFILDGIGGDNSPAATNASYAGTGTGRWVAVDQTVANAKQFGARGDGVSDDTFRLQAALTSSELMIPKGIYLIADGLSRLIDADFSIIGAGAVIDATAITSNVISNNILKIEGSESAGSPISDAAKGDRSIVSVEPVGVGDILVLESSDLWSEDRAYYTKGEIVEVESVSGSTITLRAPLLDGYTGANTTVKELTAPSVVIEGLEIIGNSDDTVTGIHIDTTNGASIIGCKIRGVRNAAFRLDRCVNSLVQNCEAVDCYTAGSGTSYGIFLSSCHRATVRDSKFLGGRHGFTVGGVGITSRFLSVKDVEVSSHSQSSTASFDMHSNAEFVEIDSVTMRTGLNINASNAAVSNCKIFNGHLDYAVEKYTPRNNEYFTLENCYIVCDPASSDAVTFSFLDKDGSVANPNIKVERICIKGNQIDAGDRALRFITRDTGQGYEDVFIDGNRVVSNGIGLDLRDNPNPVEVEFFSISGNRFKHDPGSTENLWYILQAADSIQRMLISGNTFDKNGASSYGLRVESAKSLHIVDNIFDGGGSGYRNDFTNADVFVFTGNEVSGWTNSGGIVASSLIDALVRENIGDADFKASAVFSVSVEFMGLRNRVEKYASSAPASGTYKTGDITWNSSVSPTEFIGWVCTAGGTPGTWKGFGAIEA